MDYLISIENAVKMILQDFLGIEATGLWSWPLVHLHLDP